jgi:single-strand DNA-binding protein
MNKVIMMGRLTRDPETRYSKNGSAVARYTLAVDRRFKRDGQKDADFFNCVSFGKQAEFVEKYLKKGSKILIEGELQNDNYTDKEGQQVRRDVIIVSQVEFAESKGSQAAGSTPMTQPFPNPAPDNGFLDIPDDIEGFPFA